ncbi:MAG: hypothetical protein WAM72_03460, partial [Xanthobacteraceae bacterium]
RVKHAEFTRASATMPMTAWSKRYCANIEPLDVLAMLIIGGAGIVVIFGYLFFLAYFVGRHPDIAATEGPSYVQSKRIALAAKGVPKIPFEDAIPDPQNPTLLTTTALTPTGESSDG